MSVLEDCSFSVDHCDRFGRQMILPELGPERSAKLANSHILIVGAGGLGSPICLYVAAAGVGKMTIVDGDEVSVSNLHRQVIHNDTTVNMNKAESAIQACRKLNPLCNYVCIPQFLTPEMVATDDGALFRSADVIVDATDNAQTRYLISDAAVLYGKPLVSGSALRWEGQLCVYNHLQRPADAMGPRGKLLGKAPCYRCLFPQPPPMARQAGACDVHGVVGTAPGMLGLMQAHEAIKLLAGLHENVVRKLVIYDGLSPEQPYTQVWVRGARPGCVSCGGGEGAIKDVREVDYASLAPNCHAPPHVEDRNSVSGDSFVSQKILRGGKSSNAFVGVHESTLLIDVRPRGQFSCVRLPGSISWPLDDLTGRLVAEAEKHAHEGTAFAAAKAAADEEKGCVSGEAALNLVKAFMAENVGNADASITLLCRRGNDSRVATQALLAWVPEPWRDRVKNLTRGFLALQQVEPSIPIV